MTSLIPDENQSHTSPIFECTEEAQGVLFIRKSIKIVESSAGILPGSGVLEVMSQIYEIAIILHTDNFFVLNFVSINKLLFKPTKNLYYEHIINFTKPVL